MSDQEVFALTIVLVGIAMGMFGFLLGGILNKSKHIVSSEHEIEKIISETIMKTTEVIINIIKTEKIRSTYENARTLPSIRLCSKCGRSDRWILTNTNNKVVCSNCGHVSDAC